MARICPFQDRPPSTKANPRNRVRSASVERGTKFNRVEKGFEIERTTLQKEAPIRQIVGIGLAGLFLGMGDAIATVLLPVFIANIGGGAAVLGLIEGCAEAARRLAGMKGRAVRRPGGGKRKTRLLLGGILSSVQGFLAFTLSPFQAFWVRGVSAVGEGLRGPVSEAGLDIPQRALWSGAVLGPALALASLSRFPLQEIFLFSFPLAFLATASLVVLVREAERSEDAAPSPIALSPLPRPFYPFFASAGLFRLGNVAVTLLLLRAYELLTRDHGAARAASLVVLLYILRQLLYAVTSVWVAQPAARSGKKRLLTLGYFLLGWIYLGFIFLPPVKSYIGLLPALLFFFLLLALAGIGQSLVDLTERALMIELLPELGREKGDRTLSQVRAIGSFASSAAVGALWSALSPTVGFLYAAVMCLLGGALLLRVSGRSASGPSRFI